MTKGSATGIVADGLPFLRDASRITVLTIENGKTGRPLERIDIKIMLSRHGLECEWIRQLRGGKPVVESLLTQCLEPDVDLLLMGATSHSWVGRAV